MTAARQIAVVTGSRAEFGLLSPVMQAIEGHPALDLRVLVAGSDPGGFPTAVGQEGKRRCRRRLRSRWGGTPQDVGEVAFDDRLRTKDQARRRRSQ